MPMKIVNWNKLSESERTHILQRPSQEQKADQSQSVRDIIIRVKTEGDAALLAYTKKFDRVTLDTLSLSTKDFTAVEKSLSQENKEAIQFAIEQVTRYQTALKPKPHSAETMTGVTCERQARPIETVGLYVPGGSAPLISTLIMLAVPAKIAGCKQRILCTPPQSNGDIDPHLLFTAKQCGIDVIYKIGGAQAIAAMAYGTETIPKVNKIFGPGNSWVTEAKKQVAQDRHGAPIDMPAGPSEVLVIADDKANPQFVAADLLAQAEHGPDSQVIAITVSNIQATAILESIQQQLNTLPRQAIAQNSLDNSILIIANTTEEAIQISNQYAPEHLILQIENPETFINHIDNAGAVFVGAWAPETVGDYVTGSNHVLPTDGFARAISGLSVLDFMKFISIQHVSEQGLKKIGVYAERLAHMEGLQGHKNAVSLRLEVLKDYVY